MNIALPGAAVTVPDGYVPTTDFPAMAEDALGYCHEDAGTYAVLVAGTLSREDSLFVVDDVVAGTRACMGANQGFVDAMDCSTVRGLPCLVTITKTNFPGHGIQYCLTLQLDFGKKVVSLSVFAEENGPRDMRDAAVFAALRGQGLVGESLEGWTCDPFGGGLVDGFPMNLSERSYLDARFPLHPLSELRALVAFVCANN